MKTPWHKASCGHAEHVYDNRYLKVLLALGTCGALAWLKFVQKRSEIRGDPGTLVNSSGLAGFEFLIWL